MVGPKKGELIFPPEAEGREEARDVLPSQGDSWQPSRRFGGFAAEMVPLGWDSQDGFRKLFPPVSLPFQVVDRVALGHSHLEPDRLIRGDNLHVMRQLPSESVDLIYIDPPFFSGRNYKLIFGDENEVRSFTDIWEGGIPSYLIWLNVRLFEMRRLLKSTGSIMVHCDLHAGHYIKVELDKLFGHDCFQNEIVWSYRSGGGTKRRYGRKHDVILWYSKTPKGHTFNADEVRVPYDAVIAKSRRDKFNEMGKVAGSVWDISRPPNHSKEWLGYPTQKPESLLERVIKGHSNPGDIVADFFCGGGTTAAVSQRLRRRWIACDQSLSAVSVTVDRLLRQLEALERDGLRAPDFTMEQWGIYHADRMAEAPSSHFRRFVLCAFGAESGEHEAEIHGWKGATPVWVGEADPKKPATAADVEAFARAVRTQADSEHEEPAHAKMLAWAYLSEAVEMAETICRKDSEGAGSIELELVRIDSPRFRQHLAGLTAAHADYEDFLTFQNAPISPPSE